MTVHPVQLLSEDSLILRTVRISAMPDNAVIMILIMKIFIQSKYFRYLTDLLIS